MKKPGNRMTTHINELHTRVQSIPPTPGLKRIKVLFKKLYPNNLCINLHTKNYIYMILAYSILGREFRLQGLP